MIEKLIVSLLNANPLFPMEPLSKKIKLIDKFYNNKDPDFYNFDNIKIKPILDDSIHGPVELISVVAIKIKNKQKISYVIKWLAENFPVPELLHLKRVRKLKENNADTFWIYIQKLEYFFDHCESAQLSVEQCSEVWKALVDRKINIDCFEYHISVFKVPKYPPRLRETFLECSKYWSCSFHEDLYLASLLSGSYFTVHFKEYVCQYMNKVMKLANNVPANLGQREAAVIVRDHKSVCFAQDGRKIHPLYHSSLLGIDVMAAEIKGGALPLKNIEMKGLTIGSYISCMESTKDIEKTNKKSVTHTEKVNEYICSDCDVFLSDEPCMICAMALLHSRVKRIFFARTCSHNGVLNSLCKLHTKSGLNHRYEVFQIETV